MRRLILAALLAAIPALADEAGEKLAVMRTILELNELPVRQSIFTADASIDPEFNRLWNGRPIRSREIDRLEDRAAARPTIQISHEPWGEAIIVLPWVRFEVVNPRIVAEAVRFATGDVAMVDGASIYDGANGRERRQLFLVLRKSGADWKIATIRVVDAKPRRLE